MTSITLSREMSYLKRSVMRELLSMATPPDTLSLAGGLPASEYLPTAEYQQCVNTVIEREGSRVMQYSPSFAPLREWIAGSMARRGVRCTADQVFITNGAQQGLAILSRLLLDAGEPAVIDEVTFTGIQQITAGRGAEIRTVHTAITSGIDLDSLQAAFAQTPRPRFAVLIPDFHNPLGVSLSAAERQQIAALAARYNVPVIEDDPYSALRFKGEPLAPISAYDEAGLVFYVGTFSKMIAPAMRVGWIVAPQDLIPRITVVRESFDLESSILTQKAIYEFLSRGLLEKHLSTFNAANQQRMNALSAALSYHLGDIATWTQPDGGLFMWLMLHADIDTSEMFKRAVENKVVYVPGAAFAVNGDHQNAMRLNFSNTAPEKLNEAVSRLAEVVYSFVPVLS